MTVIAAFRVIETSTTTGTGPYSLVNSQVYHPALSTGGTVAYHAFDPLTGEWEDGTGTWTTGGTLARTIVAASSNANASVSWATGTRKIYFDPTGGASQTITLLGDVTGSGTTSISATLANTSVSSGSYTNANITVDSKGRITAASNGTTTVGGPTFRVYRGSAQTVSANTFVKMQFNLKVFDTDSAYDAVTNFRFQPTAAGYYLVTGGIANTTTPATRNIVSIFKNGSEDTRSSDISNTNLNRGVAVTNVIQFNGSSDYAELFCFTSGTVIEGDSRWSFFSGTFVHP